MDSQAVAIFGAGNQGRRLAYMWSSLGGPVNIVDHDMSQLQGVEQEVLHFRSEDRRENRQTQGKITTYLIEDRRSAVKNAWLIIECVPESLKIKKDIIQDLDEVAMPNSIIVSNSSSYTISEIISGLSLRHPERIASLHSYWPPETTAIEVMASRKTAPEVVSVLIEQCRLHGFKVFHVKKDSSGYIYNRIWAAIKREALLVAAEEIATPAEVDEIFKDVLKTPRGPFELMDIVGLDVVLGIEEHYAAERHGVPDEPRELLRRMLKEGRLGRKSGKGFYDHSKL